jgi:hypothetical protein
MALMKTQRRFLTTPHQRQRLALWTLTALQWVAAVLFGGREVAVRHLHQRCPLISLERLTRLATCLLIVRAREQARCRAGTLRFWRHGRDLRPRHLIRSLLGSKLRRAFKPKGVAARIAALIGLLRNLDACARRLARRMRRGLTRLWPIKAASTFAAPLTDVPALLAFADSS